MAPNSSDIWPPLFDTLTPSSPGKALLHLNWELKSPTFFFFNWVTDKCLQSALVRTQKVKVKAILNQQYIKLQLITCPLELKMTCLQMVIKPDFAKYMIDQKAAPFSTYPVSQKTDPQTRCLLSPALPANMSICKLVILKADLPTNTTSKPASLLQLTIQGSPVAFNLIFAPDLGRFLPPVEQRLGLRAAFASTAQDQFLFLQFQTSRVQIRALLLTRGTDIHRLFKETSFFAFTQPPPELWLPNNLQTLPVFALNVPPQAIEEFEAKLEVTVAINSNRVVRKGDYRCIRLSLDKGDSSLFLHQSSLTIFKGVLLQRPLVSSRTSSGVLLGLGTEKELAVEEIASLAQISLALLRHDDDMFNIVYNI